MPTNKPDMMEVVSCELRLGPGEDAVYRYKHVMPICLWEQLYEHSKIACREAAIDVMVRELNEFIRARRQVHQIMNELNGAPDED